MMRQFGPRFAVALLARSDGHLNMDRDSTRIGTIDLPYTFGLGLRWQPAAQLDLGAQTIVRTWSGANSDLLQQGGTGAKNTYEVSAGAEYVSDPKRPYPAADSARRALRYAAIPVGSGRAGSRVRCIGRQRHALRPATRAGVDLALEHVWRSEGRVFRARIHRLAGGIGEAVTGGSGSAIPLYFAHAEKRLHRDLRLPDERGRFGADVRSARREGYVRAADPGCRCDAGQHLRRAGQRGAAGNRAGGRAAAVQASRERARRGRLHGAAAGSRASGPGPAGRSGGRARRLPEPARADRPGPDAASGSPTPSSAPGNTTRTYRRAGKGPDGVRHGTAGMRLSLHLLHRSADARAGAESEAWRM